jgi:hypothetical protein
LKSFIPPYMRMQSGALLTRVEHMSLYVIANHARRNDTRNDKVTLIEKNYKYVKHTT